jgi:hypothetical protein
MSIPKGLRNIARTFREVDKKAQKSKELKASN